MFTLKLQYHRRVCVFVCLHHHLIGLSSLQRLVSVLTGQVQPLADDFVPDQTHQTFVLLLLPHVQFHSPQT